jgi:hypothetical protein
MTLSQRVAIKPSFVPFVPGSLNERPGRGFFDLSAGACDNCHSASGNGRQLLAESFGGAFARQKSRPAIAEPAGFGDFSLF